MEIQLVNKRHDVAGEDVLGLLAGDSQAEHRVLDQVVGPESDGQMIWMRPFMRMLIHDAMVVGVSNILNGARKKARERQWLTVEDIRLGLGPEGQATAEQAFREGFALAAPVARRGVTPRSLHERDYVCPILKALAKLGGMGRSRDVLDEVLREVSPRLADRDYRTVSNGDPSWEHCARRARQAMIRGGRKGIPQGLMAENSPHGIWEITDMGRAYLAQQVRLVKT